MLFKSTYDSPFGEITLLSDEDTLLGLKFFNQKTIGRTDNLDQAQPTDTTPIAAVKFWLDRYFAGEKPAINELPLNTEVQNMNHQILKNLRKIKERELERESLEY
ncbi:methylated-DNA--[protein]-cysteine S-methyltransferase [Agrilactobacillus yilanensis]|uniref:Methylated-DNA--[protein]-cysteine S-methyltransferase n=1 Tax=Agrilactobacillus yilanensis TaxID=2485997 RepID=A0ABW4J6H4_9LACO|nr:methylated-DNA--[protein]-cysteine S-methyltransferase [Agrilactobacillus yilanensis]